MKRIGYGLVGALIGAGAGAAGTWHFMDAVNIPITIGATVLGAIIVAIGGNKAIEEIWDVVEDVID